MTADSDDWKNAIVGALNDIVQKHNPSPRQIIAGLFSLVSETFRQCEISPERAKEFYLSAAEIYAQGIANDKFED